MSMKNAVGKPVSKTVAFCGEKVTIKKLTVAEVQSIQAKATEAAGDESASISMLKFVIGLSVDGGADLTDEEFADFPIDELSKLSNEVLEYSGLGNVSK